MGLDPLRVSGEVLLVLKGSLASGISSVSFIGTNVTYKETPKELSVRATGSMTFSAIFYSFRYCYVCDADKHARMSAFRTLWAYHFY